LNVSNLYANNNTFDELGAGVPPTENNSDGLHIDGPADNIYADNNYFATGDDAWALNAPEGWVGPITNVSITNSHYNEALSAGRIYANSTVPPTGATPPTVSHVIIDGGIGYDQQYIRRHLCSGLPQF